MIQCFSRLQQRYRTLSPVHSWEHHVRTFQRLQQLHSSSYTSGSSLSNNPPGYLSQQLLERLLSRFVRPIQNPCKSLTSIQDNLDITDRLRHKNNQNPEVTRQPRRNPDSSRCSKRRSDRLCRSNFYTNARACTNSSRPIAAGLQYQFAILRACLIPCRYATSGLHAKLSILFFDRPGCPHATSQTCPRTRGAPCSLCACGPQIHHEFEHRFCGRLHHSQHFRHPLPSLLATSCPACAGLLKEPQACLGHESTIMVLASVVFGP
jgi:hypothetical protein